TVYDRILRSNRPTAATARRAVGARNRFSLTASGQAAVLSSSLIGDTPMTLSERLAEYVRACFTGIWIESHEHQDALAEIVRLCRDEDWRLAVWDVDGGLQTAGHVEAADPLAAIKAVGALATPDGTAV